MITQILAAFVDMQDDYPSVGAYPGYANVMEEDWTLARSWGRRGCSGPGSGYGVLGVHGPKMPLLLPPSILFLGLPMHRPTSPNLRRKKNRKREGDAGFSCHFSIESVYLNSFSRSQHHRQCQTQQRTLRQPRRW